MAPIWRVFSQPQSNSEKSSEPEPINCGWGRDEDPNMRLGHGRRVLVGRRRVDVAGGQAVCRRSPSSRAGRGKVWDGEFGNSHTHIDVSGVQRTRHICLGHLEEMRNLFLRSLLVVVDQSAATLFRLAHHTSPVCG